MHFLGDGARDRMQNLSVIIITLNEEEVLERCLRSVIWAEEIVVVDAGSSDQTAKIARRMGVRFLQHDFTNFAAQRNFAKDAATKDFLFYIDADEYISPKLRASIEQAIEKPQHEAYKVLRKNYYLGHEWPRVEYVERLFVKKSLHEWVGRVHESPKIEGSLGVLEGYLLHDTHRNLETMLSKTLNWSKIEAEERYLAHHPQVTWWRLIRVMVTNFLDYYLRQGGFRIGTVGLIESIYQSFSIFLTYARLWELQQSNH